MPGGEVVDMPDKPTAGQLAALERLHKTEAAQAVSQRRRDRAPTVGDAAEFVSGNVGKGMAGLASALPEAALNVWDLGKAGIGFAQGEITGKPPSEMFDPTDRSKIPGSYQSDEALMRQAGLITPNADPTSAAGRVAAGGIQAATGALMGGGRLTPGQAVGQGVAGASSGSLAQIAAEAGADPSMQILAGMGPGMAHQAMPVGKEALRQRIVQPGAPERYKRAVDAGMAPDAATVAGSGGLAQLEATSRRLPGGGSIGDEAAAARAAGVQKRVGTIASDLVPGGGVGAERAGGAVVAGAEGAIDNFRQTQKSLYTKVDALVPPATPIGVSRFAAKLQQMGAQIPGAEELSKHVTSPKVSAMHQDLQATLSSNNAASIPYSAASALRSRIGEMFEGGTLPEGITSTQAKAVYRALTEDIRGSLPKPALQAWDRANRYTRLGHERIDTVYRPLLEKDTPEKALRAAFSGTKEGSSAFRKLMGALTPAQRDVVGSHVIENMGKAPASQQDAERGQFSLQTFLTNYSKLDPGARNALYPSPRTRTDIETVAKALADIRMTHKDTANAAGTGRAVSHTGFYGAGVTGVLIPALLGSPGVAAATAAGLGGELVINRYAAKALVNPDFVKWLAEGTKRPEADQARYAARLLTIARNAKDPEQREALGALYGDIAQRLGLPGAPGGQESAGGGGPGQ